VLEGGGVAQQGALEVEREDDADRHHYDDGHVEDDVALEA